MGMGGGANKAQKAAQQAEAERQASIKGTQGAVNSVFDNPRREADIADYVGGLRDFYQQDLNRQKGDADRNLRFALARNGQVGGSTQNDQQTRFANDFAKGLLQVEQKAQGAGANLRAQDQDARSRLISLSTSGLDMATAARQSSEAMRASLDAGKSTAMMQGLGDIFGAYKTFADESKAAAQRRHADRITSSLYGGYGGGGGYGG